MNRPPRRAPRGRGPRAAPARHFAAHFSAAGAVAAVPENGVLAGMARGASCKIDVCIGAAEPERVDACQSRAAAVGPRLAGVGTRSRSACQSISGFGRSKWRLPGMRRW